MSRLLWILGWIGFAIWSLFSAAAYGLVDLVGQAAMRNADAFSADPETVEWIWRTFSWGRGLSVSVILIVWGLVSLAILAVPWLYDRLARPVMPVRTGAAAPDGVIDLSPGDWSVRSPVPGPGVPGVPRIPPRR